MMYQWMVPILLVMGIYLATWTVAEPPKAEDVITILLINPPYNISRNYNRSRI